MRCDPHSGDVCGREVAGALPGFYDMTLTNRSFRRLGATATVAGFMLAACSPGENGSTLVATTIDAGAPISTVEGDASVPAASVPGEVVIEQAVESKVEDTPSGLQAARGGDVAGLPEPLVPLSDVTFAEEAGRGNGHSSGLTRKRAVAGVAREG